MTNFLLFLTATVILNLTPGPDMLYVITRSIGQGRQAGFISSIGIAVGCLVHTLLAAFGLSALLASSAAAFDLMKYLGAAYLIYLGLRSYRERDLAGPETGNRQENLLNVFYQGVITNVFNPKVAIFFLAFLPQFVDDTKGNIIWQIILLGCIFVISGTLWNSAAALLAGHISSGLKNRPGFWSFQKKFSGTVFIALGVRLALIKRT